MVKCIPSTILLLTMLSCIQGAFGNSSVDDDDGPPHPFRIEEFIISHGYPVETHNDIETQDGYLLTIYRIPNGKKNNKSVNEKPVVFLMHGLLLSSEAYVVAGPEYGLAFLLADQGYDVWLGNARGSMHSRKHVRLNPDVDKEYWEFGVHEVGIYDMPANIDYILNKTNQEKLFFIGHSMGTTVSYILTCEIPAYNEKLKLIVSLAPSAYLGHSPYILFTISKLVGFAMPNMSNVIYNALDNQEVFPKGDMVRQTMKLFCQNILMKQFCLETIYLQTGYDFDPKLVPLVLETFPAGGSFRQLFHYNQLAQTGEFRKYDFGKEKNQIIYNSEVPPEYDLSKITAPVVLITSLADIFAPVEDVERLSKALPNLVMSYIIPKDTFLHASYIFSYKCVEDCLWKVFEIMDKFK